MVEPMYRISVVSEMVGISESLLRAWERRYQILQPRRSPSGYRAYTAQDVELLRRVKQLVQQGVSISAVVPLLQSLRQEVKAGREPVPSVDESRLAGWIAAILEAARKGEQADVRAVLDEAFSTLSPIPVLERLIVPVQRAVGDLWHARKLSSAQEHLVTHAIRSRLLSMIQGGSIGSRHVLCACLPEEDHELGLLGAALRFREAGFRVTYLGARTPIDELAALVKSLAPDVVALSQVHSIGRERLAHVLQVLQASVPARTTVAIGGAGAEAWPDVVEAHGALLVTPERWARLLG